MPQPVELFWKHSYEFYSCRHQRERVTFASEIKAMLRLLDFEPVSTYLTFLWVADPMFEDDVMA